VAEGSDEALRAFYARAQIDPVLGDRAFKAKTLAGHRAQVDLPELNAVRVRPTLAQIVSVTRRYYRVDRAQIWISTRGRGVTTPARAVAMYLCQQRADTRLAAIAEAFGLATYASAGASIRQLRERIATDKALRKALNTILLDLTHYITGFDPLVTLD
jgi:chromosomal replication initiation ATPase DnaA